MSNQLNSEYDFTLLVDGVPALTEAVEDALFAAGCDDATPSFRSGRMFISFARSAASMASAILSAIKQVEGCGIGAVVIRVDDCNLITQSEIARRIGRARQVINQYINGTRGPGGFPAPACDIIEGQPLWYWCEVSYWLVRNNLMKESELRDARETFAVNAFLEVKRICREDRDLAQEVMDEMDCGCFSK